MNSKGAHSVNLLRLAALLLIVSFSLPPISIAWAADSIDFEKMAGTMKTETNRIPDLISIFCYVAGVIAMASGASKLKDHAESPSNNRLAPALGRLIAGGCLAALPPTTKWVMTSVGISGKGMLSGINVL
ncbi:MAG: hypothetical protein PHX43_07470 [Alphaproteobacteria bacterium]|nr:hypothetical protein [Alphaproteobacteria bacterium]